MSNTGMQDVTKVDNAVISQRYIPDKSNSQIKINIGEIYNLHKKKLDKKNCKFNSLSKCKETVNETVIPQAKRFKNADNKEILNAIDSIMSSFENKSIPNHNHATMISSQQRLQLFHQKEKVIVGSDPITLSPELSSEKVSSELSSQEVVPELSSEKVTSTAINKTALQVLNSQFTTRTVSAMLIQENYQKEALLDSNEVDNEESQIDVIPISSQKSKDKKAENEHVPTLLKKNPLNCTLVDCSVQTNIFPSLLIDNHEDQLNTIVGSKNIGLDSALNSIEQCEILEKEIDTAVSELRQYKLSLEEELTDEIMNLRIKYSAGEREIKKLLDEYEDIGILHLR